MRVRVRVRVRVRLRLRVSVRVRFRVRLRLRVRVRLLGRRVLVRAAHGVLARLLALEPRRVSEVGKLRVAAPWLGLGFGSGLGLELG